MLVLSIVGFALLVALLCGRPGKTNGLDNSEMVRFRRVAEREYRDSIYPFEN